MIATDLMPPQPISTTIDYSDTFGNRDGVDVNGQGSELSQQVRFPTVIGKRDWGGHILTPLTGKRGYQLSSRSTALLLIPALLLASLVPGNLLYLPGNTTRIAFTGSMPKYR